jgi:hypothetical protein
MKNNEVELKIVNFGDVLDNTLILLKNNFIKVFLLMFLFSLPIFTTFIVVDFFGDLFFIIFSSIIFLGAYFIFVKPVYEALIINLIYSNFLEKKDLKMSENLNSVLKKTGSFAFNKILYYLLLFVIIGCFYVLISLISNIVSVFLSPLSYFFINNIDLFNYNIIINLINGIVVGVIIFFLVLVFLYFYFRIVFCTQSILVEDYSSTEAFARSYLMTKKSFIHILLSYFGLLGGVIFSLGMIYLTMWIYMGFSYVNLIVVIKVSLIFFSPIIYTLFIILFTVIYISLRIRNESLDIMLKIKNLKSI